MCVACAMRRGVCVACAMRRAPMRRAPHMACGHTWHVARASGMCMCMLLVRVACACASHLVEMSVDVHVHVACVACARASHLVEMSVDGVLPSPAVVDEALDEQRDIRAGRARRDRPVARGLVPRRWATEHRHAVRWRQAVVVAMRRHRRRAVRVAGRMRRASLWVAWGKPACACAWSQWLLGVARVRRGLTMARERVVRVVRVVRVMRVVRDPLWLPRVLRVHV